MGRSAGQLYVHGVGNVAVQHEQICLTDGLFRFLMQFDRRKCCSIPALRRLKLRHARNAALAHGGKPKLVHACGHALRRAFNHRRAKLGSGFCSSSHHETQAERNDCEQRKFTKCVKSFQLFLGSCCFAIDIEGTRTRVICSIVSQIES